MAPVAGKLASIQGIKAIKESPRVVQVSLITRSGCQVSPPQSSYDRLGYVIVQTHHHDPCPSDELVNFVLHGDIGIIPYRSDGFMDLVLPTKAYEFAWMHRPIIASDTPAIRSMFRSKSVILCQPEQVDSFATAIIDLYQHPEKRQMMIEEAAKDYTPYRWEVRASILAGPDFYAVIFRADREPGSIR